MITTLTIDDITLDPRCQPRQRMDEVTVAEYAQAMQVGATFPPVTVYQDGDTFWLADGFHRLAASKDAGRTETDVDIKVGGIRDAILHSVSANATHGLRRGNADKRRAVETMLNDPEWSTWSDREIARQCGVSHPFVARMRDLSGNGYQIARTVRRGDSVYTMQAGRIRRTWMERLGEDAPVLPPMHDALYQSLKRSIAKWGVINPVVVDQHGDIIDGFYRVQAWTQLRNEGVDVPDQYPRMIEHFHSDDERLQLYLELNLTAKSLTINEKVIPAVILHEAGHSFDEIVDALNITDLDHQRDFKKVLDDLDAA